MYSPDCDVIDVVSTSFFMHSGEEQGVRTTPLSRNSKQAALDFLNATEDVSPELEIEVSSNI